MKIVKLQMMMKTMMTMKMMTMMVMKVIQTVLLMTIQGKNSSKYSKYAINMTTLGLWCSVNILCTCCNLKKIKFNIFIIRFCILVCTWKCMYTYIMYISDLFSTSIYAILHVLWGSISYRLLLRFMIVLIC